MERFMPQECWSLINQFIGPNKELKTYFSKHVMPYLKGKVVAKLAFHNIRTGAIRYEPCVMCYRKGNGVDKGCTDHLLFSRGLTMIVTHNELKQTKLYHFRRDVLKEFHQKWRLVGNRGSDRVPCIICYARGNGIDRGCGSKWCNGSMTFLMSQTLFFKLKQTYQFQVV